MVSLQRQLNASADETLRYTRAAEDRRNEVGALSNGLKEEAARAEEAARVGEELRSSINAGCVFVLWWRHVPHVAEAINSLVYIHASLCSWEQIGLQSEFFAL